MRRFPYREGQEVVELLQKKGHIVDVPLLYRNNTGFDNQSIDTLYLAPVVACGGTGTAGGAQATFIMERIMCPNMSTHARYAK